MDSTVLPEIIPIWISGMFLGNFARMKGTGHDRVKGFDQIMPEPRGFPRFLPRPGARLSITIGQPLTSKIKPLVDDWRDLAAKEPGSAGLGGEWTGGEAQRVERSRGELADGRERDVRVKICEVLQDAVRQLGERVETDEGRFDTGLWSQSRAGSGQG